MVLDPYTYKTNNQLESVEEKKLLASFFTRAITRLQLVLGLGRRTWNPYNYDDIEKN